MATTDTGPLIPRRRLGAAFRELREARGETLQQTARALMFSASKLSRIENGLTAEPHPRDVRDLLDHFDLAGTAEAARLEELAEAGRRPGWWQVPPYDMPSRLDTFISYEMAASRIDAYVSTAAPGLLQTPDYAMAILTRTLPDLSPTELDLQAHIRLERQRHLRGRDSPPHQWYVVPETILHRQIGTPETMAGQLGTLLDAYEDPSIDLFVIPFSSGIYPAVEMGIVTIFEFEDDRDDEIVAIERYRYTEFSDRPTTLQKYRTVLDQLPEFYLDRSASRVFIEKVRRQWLENA